MTFYVHRRKFFVFDYSSLLNTSMYDTGARKRIEIVLPHNAEESEWVITGPFLFSIFEAFNNYFKF